MNRTRKTYSLQQGHPSYMQALLWSDPFFSYPVRNGMTLPAKISIMELNEFPKVLNQGQSHTDCFGQVPIWLTNISGTVHYIIVKQTQCCLIYTGNDAMECSKASKKLKIIAHLWILIRWWLTNLLALPSLWNLVTIYMACAVHMGTLVLYIHVHTVEPIYNGHTCMDWNSVVVIEKWLY